MQSLPQEVKSSELGRGRKPCISKRERKCEGNISTPFPHCFLCCMGELSRVWQASGVRSRIAGEDVPWKDYISPVTHLQQISIFSQECQRVAAVA